MALSAARRLSSSAAAAPASKLSSVFAPRWNRNLGHRRRIPELSRRRQNPRPSSRCSRNRSLAHRHRIPGMSRRCVSLGQGFGGCGRRRRRRCSGGFTRGGHNHQVIAKWLSGSDLKKVALFGCPSVERTTVFA